MVTVYYRLFPDRDTTYPDGSVALMALDRDARQERVQAADPDCQADDWPLTVNPKMYAAAMREYHRPHSVPRHA